MTFAAKKAASVELLVFLDASSAKTNGYWKTLATLSSIHLGRSTERIVFAGIMATALFLEYRVHQLLCSSLGVNEIVMVENVSADKNPERVGYIKKRDAELLQLPAYSPNVNPIETMWSKARQVLSIPITEKDTMSCLIFAVTRISEATGSNIVPKIQRMHWCTSYGKVL